jgi:glycosyltransferase involved in cell wall biosynthesis
MINVGLLFIPEPSQGGVYQYSRTILEACKNISKYNFTIYTKYNNHSYDNLGFPVKYLNLNRRDWVYLITLNVLRLKVKEPFEKEDIILASTHSPILLHSIKPFVYTLHDLQEHYYPEYFSLLERTWRNFINANLSKKAKYIVCESNYVKNDISTFFSVDSLKIVVNPAPPIIGKYIAISQHKVRAVIQKYSLPKKYFFYPAQFWKHKNHNTLLKALHLIKSDFNDIHLVFTGKASFEYNNIITLAKQLEIAHLIHHIGYVDQDELPVIYQSSLGLVLPTLFESISIPIYEAFNLGVPVCCSNVVSLPEQVGDAALLFDPVSADSMASAIKTLLNDNLLKDKLIENGYKKMISISLDKFTNGIDNLIYENVGNRLSN